MITVVADTPIPTFPRQRGKGRGNAFANSLPRWRGRVGVGVFLLRPVGAWQPEMGRAR
jgi:hypothetical protein